MDEQQASPWDKMKRSQGRTPTFKERRREASLKEALIYLWRMSVLGYLRLQFPRASQVPDGPMYIGRYVPKQNAAEASIHFIRKRERPDRETVRKPLILLGRRVGKFAAIAIFILALVALALIRSVYS